jgi:hypothetical protein
MNVWNMCGYPGVILSSRRKTSPAATAVRI